MRGGAVMAKVKAIVMKPTDNVSTVVEMIEKGTTVAVDTGAEKIEVKVTENIPFAHKFALQDIASGAEIRKYGEVIGIATQDIKKGQYVHVHNLESCRGRGDK
jgi:altronate dehydratase small subunit